MKRRYLLALIGLIPGLFELFGISQSEAASKSSAVIAQPNSTGNDQMKMLTEFRLSASHYQFFVHDSNVEYCPESFFSEPDDRRSDIGSYEQGYLTNGQTICFGTDAHLNVYWVEVYRADHPPNFGKAERVIALPLQVNSGRLTITTLVSEKEVIVSPGTWTVYLLAFSLGSDQSFDRGQYRAGESSGTLSDEQLKQNWEFERYRIVLVPGMQTPIGILHGTARVRGT